MRSSTGLLLSYWYERVFDPERIDHALPVILDSGAFSAFTQGKTIKPRDLARWVHDFPRPYDFLFNLDVIGDPHGSFRNWRTLREEHGLNPLPVLHFGDRPEEALPQYLDLGGVERVALGGIVAARNTAGVDAWLAYVMRWLARNAPEVQTHALGVHMSSRRARFPWHTLDSSSPSTAYRFGRVRGWDLSHRRWRTFGLGSAEQVRYGYLFRQYGVDPDSVGDGRTPERRSQLVTFLTRSEYAAGLAYNERMVRLGKPEVTHHIVDSAKGTLDVYYEVLSESFARTKAEALASSLPTSSTTTLEGPTS